MKTELLFFPSWVIRDFLKENGKGPHTKDYEFIAALALEKFCSIQWTAICEIGFHIKPKYTHLTKGKTGFIDMNTLTELFRKGIDENHLVDFVIAKKGRRYQGLAFQVKRFGLGRDATDTDALADYLNSLRNYTKTDTALVVIIDKISNEIDMKKLKSQISTNDYPFKRIMFIWQSGKTLCIGEIFPEEGINEYPIKDFIG